MRILFAERPDSFGGHMDQLGRWWSVEREMAWDGFTAAEKIRESGRRYMVVFRLRDQFAWRVCVLCRTWIDDIGQLHLGRPCGHQVHEQCWRQWSAATATAGGEPCALKAATGR
jgi:hypothetical protein